MEQVYSDCPTATGCRGAQLDVHGVRLEGGPRLVDSLLSVFALSCELGFDAVARVFDIFGGSLGFAVLDLYGVR